MGQSLIQPTTEKQLGRSAREIFARQADRSESIRFLLGVLAHSPAALASLDSQLAAADSMGLSARLREAIALRVGHLHFCDPGATFREDRIPIDPDSAFRYRMGLSDDAREQALLALTTKIVLDRGKHTGLAVASARDLGVADAEIVEVVALVALYTFTCYASSVANKEAQK